MSVTVHQHADGDYPASLPDSQISGSTMHLPQLNGQFNHFTMAPRSRTVSRLEDSATQTQVEESFFSEHNNKDVEVFTTIIDTFIEVKQLSITGE